MLYYGQKLPGKLALEFPAMVLTNLPLVPATDMFRLQCKQRQVALGQLIATILITASTSDYHRSAKRVNVSHTTLVTAVLLTSAMLINSLSAINKGIH